ncbi:MAG: hypothetical protein QOE56_2233 [Solirubrobacterales bacterium]|jgi:hypothetical protein|nr:hypothetical protein [Solirubrobacterales bacterium]
MIAAVRRRIGAACAALPQATVKWSRRADRAADRALERAHPVLLRAKRRSLALASGLTAWVGPRLRQPAALFFRGLALGERSVRRGAALGVRAATAASRVVTPQRAIAAVIVATGLCLIAAQFIDYRGVEIGQPGYADLPGSVAQAPTVQVRTAGQAHAYLLVPLGLIALVLGALCAGGKRRRLGLLAVGLGLVSVAVILLVDLPNGLDAGAETSRFAGASAVLQDGFYAELAAAAGLVVAGLLYYARPCRIRTNSSGRAASARRRRPRRRASSPATVARRA